MFIKPNFYAEAISNLLPAGTGFSMSGPMEWNVEVDSQGRTIQTTPKNVQLFDSNVRLPNKAEIDAEAARLNDDWVSKEYQRLRQPEYPTLDKLADAIYWQQQGDNSKMEAYLALVDEVKNKYPKG